MFGISKSGLKSKPSWQVYTRAGVMFRECSRTHRLQYRDCATNRWLDVADHNALAWVIRDNQEVSREHPAWIQNGGHEEPEES